MSDHQLFQNLKFIRKKAGFTQAALGDFLNISRQAYSNYERGARTPDFDMLKKICDMHDLTLDQLVFSDIPTLDSIISAKLTASSGKFNEDSSISYLASKNKKSDNPIYLSEEEQELIMQFRSASDETRQVLIGFLANSNSKKN